MIYYSVNFLREVQMQLVISVFKFSNVAIGLCALLAMPAFAHGIWFAERSSQTAIVYGHGAEDSDPIRRWEKFKAITAQDAQGNSVSAQWKKTDHLVLADTAKEAVVITGSLDNGFWSKDAQGKWINKGRDEVPNANESGRYLKYTTYLRGDLDKPMTPIASHRLQIVPLQAKLPHHIGAPMQVQILFDGKPVAGAKFVRDYMGDPDAKPIMTGKDGKVRFAVRNQGLNVLAVSYDASSEDSAKAAKTGLHATLSFALKHGPE
jgi:nickel transport protein